MKNLKTKITSKILDYVNIESFFIQTRKKTISYKFELLKNTKVYFIYYY